MAKQFFKDLPGTSTPLNASRLNGLLDGEEAMGNLVVDSIRSKNMWKPEIMNIYQSYCSVSLNNDVYSFVASGTDFYFGNVITTTDTAYNTSNGTLYEVKPNTSYTLTLSNTNFKKNYVTYYNSSKNTLSYERYENNSFTFTTPNNCYYISIRVGNGSATSGTTYTTTIQLEQGSTSTTYASYQNLNNEITDITDQITYASGYSYASGSLYRMGKFIFGDLQVSGNFGTSQSSDIMNLHLKFPTNQIISGTGATNSIWDAPSSMAYVFIHRSGVISVRTSATAQHLRFQIVGMTTE